MAEEKMLWEVRRDGIILVMVDQSRWQIPEGERVTTMIWQPSSRLEIEKDSEDRTTGTVLNQEEVRYEHYSC